MIFVNGLGTDLNDFKRVQKQIAKITSTITYDRPGTGKSEEVDSERSIDILAEELHDLITVLNVPEKYILVGHSMGGYGTLRIGMKRPDVFSELSHNFERFVQLINVVSEELSARAVRDDASLLEMYERWLRLQSDHLADLLVAQGVLPQRKTPGVH